MPDFSQPFILQTDASNVGLGAALCQEHDGEIFPIAYASKKLLDRETRYSVIERECLGIVWGIGKFKVYLYGQHFFLDTDLQPLIYLNRSQTENGRLMRWALFLQAYRFTIRSIPGKEWNVYFLCLFSVCLCLFSVFIFCVYFLCAPTLGWAIAGRPQWPRPSWGGGGVGL